MADIQNRFYEPSEMNAVIDRAEKAERRLAKAEAVYDAALLLDEGSIGRRVLGKALGRDVTADDLKADSFNGGFDDEEA